MLRKDLEKFVITLGVGNVILSLTLVVEMVALSILGTKYIAASAFTAATYMNSLVVDRCGFAEYGKRRDTSVISAFMGVLGEYKDIFWIYTICIVVIPGVMYALAFTRNPYIVYLGWVAFSVIFVVRCRVCQDSLKLDY